jgi:hypothetical protein
LAPAPTGTKYQAGPPFNPGRRSHIADLFGLNAFVIIKVTELKIHTTQIIKNII